MSRVTAAMVLGLRDRTNCPMAECRTALIQTQGDSAAAEELLRTGRHLTRLPPSQPPAPIKMILHCPSCGLQHIDMPETPKYERFAYIEDTDGLRHSVRKPVQVTPKWTNPPHRSHLCAGCGHIWRPADVPTEGVATIQTKGTADSAPVAPVRTLRVRAGSSAFIPVF